MSTLNDLNGLWGAALVAELRRRFPNSTEVDSDKLFEIWSILSSRGCILERPGRGYNREDIVGAILAGTIEPTYRPQPDSSESDRTLQAVPRLPSAAGPNGDNGLGEADQVRPVTRRGGALPHMETQRSVPSDEIRPTQVDSETPRAGVSEPNPLPPPAINIQEPRLSGSATPAVNSRPRDLTSAQETIRSLREQIERERTLLASASQEAEIRRLRSDLQRIRQRREQALSIGQPPLEVSDHALEDPLRPRSVSRAPANDSDPKEKSFEESIKLLMKLIPNIDRFDGSDSKNVTEELAIFEQLCSKNHIPERDWPLLLAFVLKDSARRYYRSLSEERKSTYDSARRSLIERFLPEEKLNRIKTQYNEASLKDYESLDAYSEDLLRLHKFLPVGYAPESALIDRLVNGIGQEYVSKQCRTVRPKTWTRALELIKVWARPVKKVPRTLLAGNRRKPSPPGDRANSFQSGTALGRRLREPRCGLCGKTGHWSRECPILSPQQRENFNQIYMRNRLSPAQNQGRNQGSSGNPQDLDSGN